MGIESFYINAKYKENIFKNSNKSIIEFLSILEDNGFTVRYNNKKMKYIINKILYMDILEDELYFNGISLEGCLSCFEQAYTCMVELLVLIDTKFHKIQITNNNSIFENINNKNLLITYIQDCFKHQKEKFDTIYIYKIKSLPGKEFYRKYKFFSFFPLPINKNL
jgi:hypothetical protein